MPLSGLGIQGILPFYSHSIHFTSRDMGYCNRYFVYFQEYLICIKYNYGDICQFIRDSCLFTGRDMGC